MTAIKDFYTRLGLKDNPFSSFSTENEENRFSDIFVKANDYDSILYNFSQGNSIILIGDRGTGKTALVKDLIGKVDRTKSVIAHIVEYHELKKEYDQNDFYKFTIEKLCTALFETIVESKKRYTNLDDNDKIFICYLLKNFVPQISKSHLKEEIVKIQSSGFWNSVKKLFNFFRGPLNYSATVGANILDDYIAKHITGRPPILNNSEVRSYFPELPLSIEHDFIDQNISYDLLKKVLKVSKKIGFDRTILIFDRVDEDQRFANDAEEISDYISKILTDNKFLMEPDLQVVFSCWSTPFNYIKDEVRTQKHYCPVLNWTEGDLANALDKRLSAFSGRSKFDHKNLFDSNVSQESINKIFSLSNGNPRDLWHIFSSLFNMQFSIDDKSSKITEQAIPPALKNFVTNFNYYEYYPRKSNARANSMDIYSYSKHLLKLDSEIFTKNQLNEKAQTGSSTNNYVVSMERIGLIGLFNQTGGVAQCKIRDPKIIFALKNELEIERNR